MELIDIEYQFVVNLTKFFVEKYRDKEIKDLDLIVRNVKHLCPFIRDFAYKFDEEIWLPNKTEYYKNLIEFKVQFRSEMMGYTPFRLFINKGFQQEPVCLQSGAFMWSEH